MAKKIIVALADGFEETEVIAVTDVLRRLNIDAKLVGLTSLIATGTHNIKITCDLLLDDCKMEDFDGIYLPGGLPGAYNLRDDNRIISLVKTMFEQKKLVSAICAAPVVLAKAGVLANKKFTMYPGFEDELFGAIPTGNPAEIDDNLVTGKGPGAVFDTAYLMASTLVEKQQIDDLYAGMFIKK